MLEGKKVNLNLVEKSELPALRKTYLKRDSANR